MTELDPRTERNLLTLTKEARAKFIPFIKAAKKVAAGFGCEYVAISGSRTWKEQNALYAKGRTVPGPKVTNARAGYSWHNFGLAMDFGVFVNGKYLDSDNPKLAEKVHAAVGAIAPQHGIEWGGQWKTFKDTPHFQVYTGKTLAQLRAEHPNGKGLDAV